MMTAVPLLESQVIAYVPASAVLPSVHSFTARPALPKPLLDHQLQPPSNSLKVKP